MNYTDKEKEIMQLVARSYTNVEISKKIFVSEDTVKTHLVRIYKKRGCNRRICLATWIASNTNVCRHREAIDGAYYCPTSINTASKAN